MLREESLYGNEITNTARITKMNMILADDGHSNIHMKDSLANPVDGKTSYIDERGQLKNNGYDVVITNMPYSQKTKYGNLYDLPSANGDSICVQHCIKAVNCAANNGRIALVVPEGFLFRKDLAKVREYMLENCQLQSIISFIFYFCVFFISQRNHRKSKGNNYKRHNKGRIIKFAYTYSIA